MTEIVRKTPCSECAFLRTCKPGLLGGSPVETYIGQAIGPFRVPCHMQTDFRDPDWKDSAWDVQQCGGLSVFRTNIGVDALMPDALPCLPASADVFATMAEFVAHHKQIPLMLALRQLDAKPPSEHLKDQLKRPDNKVRLAPRRTP